MLFKQVFIPLLKKFRAFNFHGYLQPRKFFNSENFPIYGTENTNSLNLLHSGAKLEQFSKHVNISFLQHRLKFMQCRPASRMLTLTFHY